jgi:NAD+ synthase
MKEEQLLHQDILIDPEPTSRAIEKFIGDKTNELRRTGVIIGLSGGIDSAVVAALAVRALGPEKVFCVFLPEKHSSNKSAKHAKKIADKLGVNLKVKDITRKLNKFSDYRIIPGKVPMSLLRKAILPFVKKSERTFFEASLDEPKNKIVAKASAFYGIKHRMRMVTLYYMAEQMNYLVAGAANKTEFSIGYYVKYGCDDASDIMPIIHLYKTQVKLLAEFLDIPGEIIEKPPSPDMIPGMTDENVIGLPYETLDLILLGMESGLSAEQIAEEVPCETKDVDYVLSLTKKSQYSREIPYMCSG